MRRPKCFVAHPYPVWVVNLVGWKDEDVTKYVKKQYGVDFVPPAHASSTWLEKPNADAVILVHIRPMKKNADFYGLLAHECVHAASQIFQVIGARHNLKNEETYTYLVQCLVTSLLAFKQA